jgi:hypothetical protein
MIHDGVKDPERIRKATGLHHKQVEKMLREYDAGRVAAREAELVG